ncbi:MAG: hypothetical protein KR126chlam3_01207 [Chlamydiae bacterium]|nr:hypothetical protein [Chlamydiota bacterium]
MSLVSVSASPPPQKPPAYTGDLPPQKPQVTAYSSTLSSPHAPTWVKSVSDFFQWIWSRITSFFSWFLPQKKTTPEKTPSSADTPQPPKLQKNEPIEEREIAAPAVQNAPMNEEAHKSPMRELLTQTAASAGFSWIFGNSYPFVAFVANKAVHGSTLVVEKIANYAFPEMASHRKKVGGLAISTPIVWYAADHLGYPLGKLFLLIIGFTALQTITEAHAAAAQQHEMLLKQHEMRLKQLTA